MGWSRLLAGRLRDPLVGRDLLVGGLAGVAFALLINLATVAPAWFNQPTGTPRFQVISSLGSLRHLVYFILWSPYPAVTIGFGTLLMLYLDRIIFRSYWLALVLVSAPLYFLFGVITGSDELWSLSVALFTVGYMVVVLRAGLLTAVTSMYVFLVVIGTPLTSDLSSWYAERTLTSMTLLVALLGYGFWFSLGGKPLFGNALTHQNGDGGN